MNIPYLKISVLVADDHEMVREGLLLLLGKIAEVEVVGTACNGKEVLTLAKELHPDVILMDVKMPGCDGVEATRAIKEDFPHIGVVALSSFDEESMIMDMLNAGARGYLLKNAGKQELTAAIQAAYRDEAYYCKEINLRLSQMVARGGVNRMGSIPLKFTEREMQVISLICEGLPSKQIAASLNLRTRTVERYRDTIMKKMDVNNAAGVVLYAVTHGLYSSSPKS